MCNDFSKMFSHKMFSYLMSGMLQRICWNSLCSHKIIHFLSTEHILQISPIHLGDIRNQVKHHLFLRKIPFRSQFSSFQKSLCPAWNQHVFMNKMPKIIYPFWQSPFFLETKSFKLVYFESCLNYTIYAAYTCSCNTDFENTRWRHKNTMQDFTWKYEVKQ